MKNTILVTAMLLFSTAIFAQATWEDNDPGANLPTGFLGWDDVTNENLDILQNNTLRQRFTSVNWTGLNGLPANNASRIHLGLNGNFQNPFSLIHMGTNLNGNLQRPWMNVGMTMGATADILHLGLIERPVPGGPNAQVDAVLAWGCNDDEFVPGAGPDNFRFLFITPTTANGDGAEQQGRETVRITPMGNVGIGDFSHMPNGIANTYGQPRARLDVQFFGNRPDDTENIAVNVSNTALLSEPFSRKYGIYSYAENTEEVLLDRVYGGYFEGVGGRSPVGVFGTARGDQVFPFSTKIGVEGLADEAIVNATNVGVRGSAYNTSGNSNAMGVWGNSASNTPGHWAGYFSGPTWCSSGMWQGSDESIKLNIEPIENAYDLISALSPKTYTYNLEEYPTAGLPSGEQFGLIAQEVQELFPDFVRTVKLPNEDGEVTSESEEILALNYTSFIPLLISTVQEQKSLIDDQNEALANVMDQLESIQQQLNSCCQGDTGQKSFGYGENENQQNQKSSLQGNILDQNTPNPFRSQTNISYTLEEGGKVTLNIFDKTGKPIATLVEAEQSAGNYRYEWDASGLPAGLYHYALYVDGDLLVKKAIKLAD